MKQLIIFLSFAFSLSTFAQAERLTYGEIQERLNQFPEGDYVVTSEWITNGPKLKRLSKTDFYSGEVLHLEKKGESLILTFPKTKATGGRWTQEFKTESKEERFLAWTYIDNYPSVIHYRTNVVQDVKVNLTDKKISNTITCTQGQGHEGLSYIRSIEVMPDGQLHVHSAYIKAGAVFSYEHILKQKS